MFEKDMFDTTRLRLQPFTRNELTVFKEMVRDSEVKKYFFEDISSSGINTENFFNYILSQNKEYDASFAIIAKSSNQVVGCMRLFSLFSDLLVVEYVIRNGFRGNNYAQEALSGTLEYIRKFKPHISTVLFKVNKRNIASQKVLEKFGATRIEMDANNFEFSLAM